MEFAVCIFPCEYTIPPTRLAVALEERGFESLWVAEHSHIPVARTAPWPGGPVLPQMYYDTLDPFVCLAAAASVTERLKVATGIALIVQRDPIHTAKQVASLDVLSGGRFLFGVGAGWGLEEMANHGTDPDRRFGLMRERIEAMKAIWAGEEAEYHGDQVDFDPIFQNPKPIQTPHPPIHVGGVMPGGLRRAVRYGDGWIPIAGRGDFDPAGWLTARDTECERVGRDPSEVEVSVYGAPHDRAVIEEMAQVGVDRAVFGLPPDGADTVLPILDELADMAGLAGGPS
ncbi:MAG TPA: LLM class F420-dependent oxidoreductase [Acidimicrobiia bacterium]|nr:LLM class F420-dependent oxidoreductase [Acidimicrobiia bacterium]